MDIKTSIEFESELNKLDAAKYDLNRAIRNSIIDLMKKYKVTVVQLFDEETDDEDVFSDLPILRYTCSEQADMPIASVEYYEKTNSLYAFAPYEENDGVIYGKYEDTYELIRLLNCIECKLNSL